LIRELDASRRRAVPSRAFSSGARRKVGLNRGRATAIAPSRADRAASSACGLRASVQGASERTPFANVLIVAAGSPRVNVERAASAASTRVSAAKA
jgi:hypothetical protein